MTQRDFGSRNPRMQCGVCGRWMRLVGRDSNGAQYQRFFGSYETMDGTHHEHVGNVCVPCESKLPNWKGYSHPMLTGSETKGRKR